VPLDLPNDPRGRELVLLIERAKYERFILGETQSLIEREFSRIIDIIVSSQFRSLTQFQRARTLQLFAELNRQIHSGYGGLTDLTLREMHGYATLESEISDAVVRSMIPGTPDFFRIGTGAFLPSHTLQSIAALPIQGLKIGEWFDAQANTMTIETRRIIQNGLIEGKSPAEITRRILADGRTEGPVLSRRAINEARSITRTTVTAVQNQAAQLSYENLPDSVSDSYRYAAIRDNRTTVICIALDGRVFKYSDPKKKVPPQHIGCRSGVIPLVRGADGKLIEPLSTPHSFASYGDWLKTQSTEEQNRILGASRAGFWRSGKMSLTEAIDGDNRVLTLPQLRNRLGIGVGAGR
jgi:SPP1 gp7 family putative phage head morphogenesis protein